MDTRTNTHFPPSLALSVCVLRLPESVVSGVLSSVSDIAYSLRHFMDVYPPSVPLAVQAGLLER